MVQVGPGGSPEYPEGCESSEPLASLPQSPQRGARPRSGYPRAGVEAKQRLQT